MGFFDLFGQKAPPADQQTELNSQNDCPHLLLAPRWDNVDDIGHEDKAVGFRCTACGAWLTLDEGEAIRRHHSLPVG